MLLCLPILFSFQFTFLAIGMIVEDEYYLFIVGSAINFVGFLESLATNLFTSKLVNSFSYISYDKFVKLKAKNGITFIFNLPMHTLVVFTLR